MALGMTNYELAQLGIQAGAGLASGLGQRKANEMSKEEVALKNRILALQNMANTESMIGAQRQDRANQFADRNPLGAEQQYAMRQMIRQAILPQLQNSVRNMGGPTNPNVASRFQGPQSPLANMDLSGIMNTLSNEATTQALVDRRNSLAAIDPTSAQYFNPLSTLGLDRTGVGDYQNQLRTQERLQENDQTDMILRDMAKQQYGLTEEKAQEMERRGGGGFWRNLAKVGIIAGGAALMATGVGGPAGAMLIGAATGAGSGAIDGGWRGALIGAGMGAATGGLGGGAAGAGAARAAGATTGQLVRSAILNPQTIGQMTGAAIGGRTGALIGLGSGFLPGANYGRLGVPNAGFERANTTLGGIPGNASIDTTAPTSPFLESRNITGGSPVTPNMHRPQLGSTGGGGGRNFISPQDLALAGGRPPLPPAQTQLGNIPDPRFQFMTGGTNRPQSPLTRLGLTNDYNVQGSPVGPAAPGLGRQLVNSAVRPGGLATRTLQGQVVNSGGPAAPTSMQNMLQGGAQRQLPGSTRQQMLPSGPQQLQLPRGQYNMPQSAGPGSPINLGSSPLNAQTMAQLQQLLSRLPDGASRMQVLRDIILRGGGQ
jgi:hypothetical protein